MAGRLIIDGVQPANTNVNALFTAPDSNHVRIGAFTITNSTATSASCEIYICGDKRRATPSDANRILTTEVLAQNETLCPPELINQLIPAYGSIFVKVSDASTLSFRASGADA